MILSAEGQPRQVVLLVQLALVVAAGALCADLALRLLAMRLEAPAAGTAAAVAAPTARPVATAREGYQPLVARNLFGAEVREAVAPKAAAPAATAGAAAAPTPPKSARELGLTLQGTVAGPPSLAFAIIRHGAQQELYRVGDEVSPGVTLAEVRPGEVVLARGSERLLLTMEEAKPGAPGRRGRVRSVPRRTPAAANAAAGIRQVAPNSYLLDRETVTQSLKNLSNMMRDIRVVPSFDAARRPNGYRVASIRYGSLLDKLGLKRGDVIQAINGLPISDPDRAYQAYQQLKDESSIQIDVLRNSRPITLTYEIQ